PRTSTRSSSPSGQRQFLASRANPASRYLASAASSPRAPSRTVLGGSGACSSAIASPNVARPADTNRRISSLPGRARFGFRSVGDGGGRDVATERVGVVLARELLDVHVAGREHPNLRHEPCRPVHVPHPRIPELDLEPRPLAGRDHDLVAQV